MLRNESGPSREVVAGLFSQHIGGVALEQFKGKAELVLDELARRLPSRPQLEIAFPVVEPISVDVVNRFIGQQSASQLPSRH